MELNEPGPLQLYVTPLVTELPLRVTLVLKHVNEPDADADTPLGWLTL